MKCNKPSKILTYKLKFYEPTPTHSHAVFVVECKQVHAGDKGKRWNNVSFNCGLSCKCPCTMGGIHLCIVPVELCLHMKLI